MLVDTHCHLDALRLDKFDGELPDVLALARERGIGKFLTISTGLKNIEPVKQIAAEHKDVYCSVGIHPLDVGDGTATCDELIAMAEAPKVVALGETGLDYYYSKDTVEVQQESFRAHLEAGKRTKLPVIVHTRDARDDTLRLLREHADPESAGVLHCFTETWEMAQAALDLNFYISISGIVTFRNAESLRDVVRKLPLERLLVETDSPYLAPVPYRGKANIPAYVKEVAEFVAELRGLSPEALAEITTENFHRLFPRAQ
ncbi:TatD family hydrolase [Biformimicrobium ophioploci]|uniref:TatD family hydrolase n=1 Tax=Biformimicrobium ophioploci TaxID=3036711 RepID=A0ABQ6M1X6_9GAMM|nr:TatD family hydrolase [Microbulbifer sp. NKW57]GMG88282.1 TatD family hydrolase [Microbulbifer sp. NKW57]